MILVIGGTGSVGRKVVEGLLEANTPVRVLAAGLSDWRGNSMPHFRKIGVEVVVGDVRDHHLVAGAVAGCTGIVHTAGILIQTADEPFETVNFQSVASLIPIAQNAGIQRFIYVSCLGATQFNESEYLKSKWQAENLIRESSFFWTVFRPSLIFDEESPLLRSLEWWVRRFPVTVVVGSGLNHLPMVSATDVAACIVQSVYNRETVNQVYDLCGPETVDLQNLLEIVSYEVLGRHRPTIKIPAALGYKLADFLPKLNRGAPISSDLMRLITTDFQADPAIMQKHFKVPALPLESLFGRLSGA